jgi:hypothetical protein
MQNAGRHHEYFLMGFCGQAKATMRMWLAWWELVAKVEGRKVSGFEGHGKLLRIR